jgi:RHS repeat-associated protein
VLEYSSSGAVLNRYVHGPGIDEPIVWYSVATLGSSTRNYLHADRQGSVVALTSGTGNTNFINTYDPYGIPGTGNHGRFQYTGQTYISMLGLYYYKARIYNPTLGRFMQTDPVGYKDDVDLYAYVGNDPLDRTDPMGLEAACIVINNCDVKIPQVSETTAKVIIVGTLAVGAVLTAGVIAGVGTGASAATLPSQLTRAPRQLLPRLAPVRQRLSLAQ